MNWFGSKSHTQAGEVWQQWHGLTCCWLRSFSCDVPTVTKTFLILEVLSLNSKNVKCENMWKRHCLNRWVESLQKAGRLFSLIWGFYTTNELTGFYDSRGTFIKSNKLPQVMCLKWILDQISQNQSKPKLAWRVVIICKVYGRQIVLLSLSLSHHRIN